MGTSIIEMRRTNKLICTVLFIMVMVIGMLLERETMVMYGGFLLIWNELRTPADDDDDDEVEKWS